jgi:hypothetical protein
MKCAMMHQHASVSHLNPMSHFDHVSYTSQPNIKLISNHAMGHVHMTYSSCASPPILLRRVDNACDNANARPVLGVSFGLTIS